MMDLFNSCNPRNDRDAGRDFHNYQLQEHYSGGFQSPGITVFLLYLITSRQNDDALLVIRSEKQYKKRKDNECQNIRLHLNTPIKLGD